MSKSISISAFFCFLFIQFSLGQSIKLIISFDETCIHEKTITSFFTSQKDVYPFLNSKINELYQKGFAASYIDTISPDTTSIKAFIHCNANYSLKINQTHVANAHVFPFTFESKFLFKTTIFNQESIKTIHNSVLSTFENNGYPYTTTKLDSIKLEKNTINSTLLIEPGIYIKIDSINVKGDLKLKASCLYACINLKPGDAYNQKKIDKIQSRLNSLEIASISKAPTILIQESNAFISIKADKKQTGEFDGIIGILPNHYISGKVVISGDMHVRLNNSFGHAEELSIDWQRKDAGTQQIETKIIYPYILNTPISPEYQLNLYRKDSSYITSTNQFSIQYRFNGKNYFKSFAEISKTTQIKSNSNTTNSVYNTSTNMYGIEFFIKQVNQIITPTKGFQIQIITGAGTKKIQADSIQINNIYSKPIKNSSQYKATCLLKYYLPLYQRSILYIANNSNWVYTKYPSIHDFSRIGGFKSLRGFDEETFKLSTYSIYTLEYRYMLERNSYLTTFVDHAFFVKTPENNIQHNQATGFGIGSVFETKAGIFSIYYAVGSQASQPIQLKNAKIHFGYINRF